MKVTDKIMEQLVKDCQVTLELFCGDPNESYFKGLHEQSIRALRNIATIIEYHGGDDK